MITNLDNFVGNIQSREDFLEFMEIINGYRNLKDGELFNKKKFANENLIPFYDGILIFLSTSTNFDLKHDIKNDSDEITWKLFAEMIIFGINNYKK